MPTKILSFFIISLGLVAQDEPAKPEEPKEETVEVEVKVGKRPTNVYNMPGFKVKDPLVLEGKAAEIERVRTALAKALKYILDRQGADGAWAFDPRSQLRPEVPRNELGFVRTAGDSMNKIVLTSLACMALRSHEELAPDRIKAAVEKGLQFVIDNAPKHAKAQYGVWTWSFSIEFLAGEYRRSKDESLKARIKDSIKSTADRLLQNQHKGLSELPKLPPKAAKGTGRDDSTEAASRDKKDRKSNGGYFGVTPSENDDPGKEGALIQGVEPRGPAGTAGLKGGDRIIEIDGVKIESVNQLYDLIDGLVPDQKVKVKVLRQAGAADQPAPRRQGQRQPAARGRIPEDGGWSYYQMGAMSFCTATAVMALLEAQSIGIDIPQDAIDRGIRFVQASKLRKEGAEEDAFAYSGRARGGPVADVRASIGRVAVCTLAEFQTGKAKIEDLQDALDTFVRRRGELDRVRGYPGNHFVRSFQNAAYYFLYGHYNSAHALHFLKDEATKVRFGAFVQEALLKIQYEQGTWTDHEAWGQVYGTAMAVMALGELKFVTPEAYKKPIDSLRVLGDNEY